MAKTAGRLTLACRVRTSHLGGWGMTRRRNVLKAIGTAAIAFPALVPRSARAAGWGELPSSDPQYWPAGVPRDHKLLELHLSGGLSHYETFHVRTDLAGDARWFGKRAAIEAVNWAGCGSGAPASATEVRSFSGAVGLGPATKPLWPFASSMRVVAMQHDLFPHEVAIPVSLTGLRPGNPKAAGLGAAVERRATSSRTPRSQPYSYVLMPSNLGIDDDSFQGFHATGLHGGRFRPLLIRMPTLASSPSGRDEGFLTALDRAAPLRANDPLLRQFAAQYRDRLRHRAAPGTLARSSEFAAYDAALEALILSPQLRTTLDAAIAPVADDNSCVDGTGTLPNGNMTRAALRTAARLLALPEADGGARYVGVVDGGIRATTGGGYDVHGAAEYPRMFTNLWNVLTELASLMHRPPAGAAADPQKIDLRDTVVLLNTEFGRTPTASGGRNHWPAGYVTVLIGGPVASGVAGSVGTDGVAVNQTVPIPVISASPADVHAAMLMLAGIDPFDDANFGVGDVGAGTRSRGGGTEPGTAQAIRQHVLGF